MTWVGKNKVTDYKTATCPASKSTHQGNRQFDSLFKKDIHKMVYRTSGMFVP